MFLFQILSRLVYVVPACMLLWVPITLKHTIIHRSFFEFSLYSAQASFSWPRVDLARLLRRAYSRSVWIISFKFVNVCGIRFSTWESFIGFYFCCYPISTILACLFSVGVRISWKKLCWMRACRRKWHLVSPTLYIITAYRVNLNKLLQIITQLRWSNKDNNN